MNQTRGRRRDTRVLLRKVLFLKTQLCGYEGWVWRWVWVHFWLIPGRWWGGDWSLAHFFQALCGTGQIWTAEWQFSRWVRSRLGRWTLPLLSWTGLITPSYRLLLGCNQRRPLLLILAHSWCKHFISRSPRFLIFRRYISRRTLRSPDLSGAVRQKQCWV